MARAKLGGEAVNGAKRIRMTSTELREAIEHGKGVAHLSWGTATFEWIARLVAYVVLLRAELRAAKQRQMTTTVIKECGFSAAADVALNREQDLRAALDGSEDSSWEAMLTTVAGLRADADEAWRQRDRLAAAIAGGAHRAALPETLSSVVDRAIGVIELRSTPSKDEP